MAEFRLMVWFLRLKISDTYATDFYQKRIAYLPTKYGRFYCNICSISLRLYRKGV